MSILSKGLHRFGRRTAVAVFGATVVVAALGAGSAQAGVRAGLTAFHGPVRVQIQRYFTPTANLDTVANALQFNVKSITGTINLPSGLTVTHPVDISVSRPISNQTQPYQYLYGNGWNFTFPANNGVSHTEQPITVTLTEHVTATTTQSYQLQWAPVVTPLYNISISPLKFNLLSDCDFFGDSEIGVQYVDPDGVQHAYSANTNSGENGFFVAAFARSYQAVGETQNLRAPGVQWWEKDWDNSAPAAPSNGFNLGNHTSYHYSAITHEGTGQDCEAQLSYSVSRTLLSD